MTTVIAHRGASAAHPPGNTIEAFRSAGHLGATWVELDVRRAADGALAVHHDPDLPDGRAIVSLRADELPTWVPVLETALDACAGLGVNVEIKNLPTEPDFDPDESIAVAIAALARGRSEQPLLISSFHLATIDRVRALAPSLPTAFLVLEMSEKTVALAVERGHTALHPFWPSVDARTMQLADQVGLAVNVWTVDDPEEIRRLADLGVAGIVTNVPDVASAVLAPP